MKRVAHRLALAGCVLAGVLHAGAAPAPWLELRSAHFTVITNAGEKEGRRVAWQFEQIRGVLMKLWPWARIDAGQPFVVFAARDEATLKTLGPQYWEGKRYRPISFHASGRDRNFVALRTDVAQPDDIGVNPYQTAYWSYSASVFARQFPRPLPNWYSRGIAEVMSNTIVRDKELHVGRPLRENLISLREQPPIPLAEFLAADSRSHWLTQEQDARLFDAQAWAQVHYLIFGEKAANQGRVNQLNRMLLDGKDPALAVREIFGDMRPYFDGMREYVQKSLFSYVRIPVTTDTRPEAYASRVLSAGESAVARAELLVAMGRPAEARALAGEAAKADATLPGPSEIEAQLLDSEGHSDEARAALARAVAAGSTRARIYYRLAQLEWTQGADKAQLEHLAEILEKAHALEPDDASTLSFLADTRTDLGHAEEGARLARRAVEVDPSSSYHRLALARALWALRQTEEAVQSAQAALQAADDDKERQQAQAFLDFAARAIAVVPAPAPASRADAPTLPAPAIRIVVDAKDAGDLTACFERHDDAACGHTTSVLAASCESGQAVACRSLGSLYDGGFGVAVDKSRAATAYSEGCRRGDNSSCARFAVLQAQGQGVERESTKALSTLQHLCADKVDDACIGWAMVLAAESGKAELAKARQLLAEACGRGSEEACRLAKSLPR